MCEQGGSPEEEPARDERIVLVTRGLVHDIFVRRIESEGGGGETVGDKVDPEQLHWDERLGKTQRGSQEDADNFTNVGRDQVPET